MSKLTFEVSVGNIKAYLNKLAVELTNHIALDKDVVLQNTMMEGGLAIGIDTWDDVKETIADALRLWCHAMSNRTALPVPIPKSFYTLLYYLVYRGAKDQRGGVRFKLKIQNDFLPSGVNTGYQQALFGAEGYFRKRFSFLEGLEYLENGVPIVPDLIIGKENNLLSSKKTISEKVVRIPAHRVLSAIQYKTEVKSVGGIDGFDLDTTGLMSLIPFIQLEQESHFEVIEDRLVVTNYTSESDLLTTGLAACWLMAKGDELYAIRNLLPCTPNSAMLTDLQRALIEAEEMTPTVDLPSNVQLREAKLATPKNLELQDVAGAVFTAYSVMNPYFLTFTGASAETINAWSQTLSRAVGTVVQSESLRAHKYRFLTFNSSTGGMTGFTFFYTVPKSGDAQTINDISQLDFVLTSVRTLLNSYKVVRSAPLISTDLNRVPITPKYCLFAVGDSADDNTSANSPFESEEKSVIRTEGIFKFIQKSMRLEVDAKGDVSIEPQSLLDIANFLTGQVPRNLDTLRTKLEILQGPDVDSNGVTRADISSLIQEWDFSKCTTSSSVGGTIHSMYSFTKLKEAGLINNSDKLRYCFYYPLLKESHKLVRNGYCKNGKFYEDPSRTIARANLVDRKTGKAVTEYGVIVSGLLQKGGFGGFGDILGALTGSLGAVAGGFLGVPQLGQITGQLGKVGGDLLGDLF